MYDIENYYQAKSVKDAVRLLNEHPDARIISGGSDVLIKIREGKFAGTSLVSFPVKIRCCSREKTGCSGI